MNFPLKIAIHVPTGKFIHIDNAENGNNCNCKCFECGGLLTAKQGDKRTSHFSHIFNLSCTGGKPETLRHKLAKQILVDNNEIFITNNKKLVYSNGIAEKPFKSIRPDVTAISKGIEIYFEVWVENPKDEETKIFYKANRLRCIEMNLSKLPLDSTYEEIKFAVLNDYTNKEEIGWISEQPVKVKKESFGDFFLRVFAFVLIVAIVIGFVKSVISFFSPRSRLR